MPTSEVLEERARTFAAMYDEEEKARRLNTYEPGSTLYLFLSKTIDPAQVLFSEWLPDVELSGPETRAGKLFLVLPAYVVFVTYEKILEGRLRERAPLPPPGEATVTWHPKGTPTVAWNAPSIEFDRGGVGDARVCAIAEAWSVELPYSPLPLHAMPAYVASLLAALHPSASV